MENIFSHDEMVYLSPDGAEILQSIEKDKVYVIGGFVDRSVNKNQSAMRAADLNIPSRRLPLKEFYPECSHPVMNVNTMVEILTAFMDTGDWRSSLQKSIPLRKVHSKANCADENDYRLIRTEDQLVALPLIRLTKYEFKNALDRLCIKECREIRYEVEENSIQCTDKIGIDSTVTVKDVGRFIAHIYVDGKLVGVGSGSSKKIASAFASWRALKACGEYNSSTYDAELVSE